MPGIHGDEEELHLPAVVGGLEIEHQAVLPDTDVVANGLLQAGVSRLLSLVMGPLAGLCRRHRRPGRRS